MYRIKYEDGDSEDLTDNELEDCKKLYLSEQKKKHCTKKRAATSSNKKTTKTITTKSATTTKRPASAAAVKTSNDDDDETDGKRKRTRVSYKEDNSDDADDDDDDEEFDDVAAAAAAAADDDVLMDDSLDDDDDDDDMSVESDKKPAPKKKAPAAKKKTATTKKETAKSGGKKDKTMTPEEIMQDYYERVEKAKKTYKPNDNPQKWPESGDYVDPVGMDPTNGIIEGIIASQVQKVAGLLQLVKSCKNDEDLNTAGELCFPITLNTACSGTDAPSIALELIQESFDKMCPENKFDYKHRMSCEIESFKQSYIHR